MKYCACGRGGCRASNLPISSPCFEIEEGTGREDDACWFIYAVRVLSSMAANADFSGVSLLALRGERQV